MARGPSPSWRCLKRDAAQTAAAPSSVNTLSTDGTEYRVKIPLLFPPSYTVGVVGPTCEKGASRMARIGSTRGTHRRDMVCVELKKQQTKKGKKNRKALWESPPLLHS